MAAFNKFNTFTDTLARGVHNFASDTIKVILTNSAPTSSGSVTADITQITQQNGYLTGGNATTITLAPSGGVESINGTNVVFTASGGSFGPLEYAVLYNSTKGLLIGWFDYGSAISVNNGETFTVAPAAGTWATIT